MIDLGVGCWVERRGLLAWGLSVAAWVAGLRGLVTWGLGGDGLLA